MKYRCTVALDQKDWIKIRKWVKENQSIFKKMKWAAIVDKACDELAIKKLGRSHLVEACEALRIKTPPYKYGS